MAMRLSLRRISFPLALALGLAPLAAPAALRAQEAAAAPAAAPPLRTFEVSAATSPIKIDAVLDEPAWGSALVVDLPYEWYPGDNTPAAVKTEALVTYDETNVYVAFRAFDPDPAQIRAHYIDRDAILLFIQDDHVGFTLDTFDDERRAYHFRVNPLGVQIDAIFSERTAAEDYSWDAIWDSAGRITADGYVVEVAIPLKQIRFPHTDAPQTWGFEAFRSYPRSVRFRLSSRFTDRAKDCLLCQENKVSGFTNLRTGRNLELTPTLTGIKTDSLDDFPDGELQNVEKTLDPGVSLRWGVTPNVSLNATVNPDFSQVEADAAQLDINTRFALFYPEKRPFFLEGAELFQTPLEAVFTRTVADPRWGAKLTAKQGENNLGVFAADDRINNVLIPANQGSSFAFLDEDVTSGVVHYGRELGKFSSLGVLYTDREASDYHNRVGGLDGFLRFTPSDTVKVQYLRSDTLYPEAVATRYGQSLDAFDGDALSLRYDHFARGWKGFVRYEDLDPRFRADSGFIPRVDVKTSEVQYQRLLYGDADDWYAQIALGARGLRTEDHTGLLTDQEVELFGIYYGPMQSVGQLQLFDVKEYFNGVTFDLRKEWAFFQFNPSGNVRTALTVRRGDEIDFDNTRRGDQLLISPNLLMRLGRHFSLELDYLRQELKVEGGRLFAADLAQANAIYNFNLRTFVRAIVQYTRIDRNPELYTFAVEPRTEDLFSQLLFSYKINPQTVLFVGYTDSRFGLEDVPLTQTDRTFFLKLGYAFLF
jgi:Domain of unknown function (DUF5916)/Carbohydrate family 9 binding domain-like